ncbi:hypothetical protein LJC14_01785, partial [Treponema sp. OttesenSCG-928-L16]|nr:hypothetical protein [Treponema sp. OttesenSCG-928-L16]
KRSESQTADWVFKESSHSGTGRKGGRFFRWESTETGRWSTVLFIPCFEISTVSFVLNINPEVTEL